MDVELAPAEQLAEGVDLVEGEIVTRHDANVGSRAQRREDERMDEREASLGDEGGDDGDLRGARKQRRQVLHEWIVVAAGREGAGARAGGGGALDRRGCPPAVGRLPRPSSRDDMNGGLGDGLACELTCREAHLVALLRRARAHHRVCQRPECGSLGPGRLGVRGQ